MQSLMGMLMNSPFMAMVMPFLASLFGSLLSGCNPFRGSSGGSGGCRNGGCNSAPPAFNEGNNGNGCNNGGFSREPVDFPPGSSRSGAGFTSRATSYYPHNSAMEGGYFDRKGRRLHTLQDYLEGRAPYVSVAMDTNAFKYGQKLRIPELEQKYGRSIDFRVVDTGGAFRGRGTSRIDICTRNYGTSVDPSVNRNLTIIPQA